MPVQRPALTLGEELGQCAYRTHVVGGEFRNGVFLAIDDAQDTHHPAPEVLHGANRLEGRAPGGDDVIENHNRITRRQQAFDSEACAVPVISSTSEEERRTRFPPLRDTLRVALARLAGAPRLAAGAAAPVTAASTLSRADFSISVVSSATNDSTQA